VKIANQRFRIEKNQVLFERERLRDDLAIRAHGQSSTVKHQAVIAPNLIDHAQVPDTCRQTRQHVVPQPRSRSRTETPKYSASKFPPAEISFVRPDRGIQLLAPKVLVVQHPRKSSAPNSAAKQYVCCCGQAQIRASSKTS